VELTLANDWDALLGAIQRAGKYVTLDMSACTMSGTEFDPGAANTGESKIVSLVLPAGATSIKGGTNSNPTFKNFTSLTSVSGSAVETVGSATFWRCTALTEVSLPAAISIGGAAFSDCTSLTEVNLPKATSINTTAFNGCTALTEVSLPAATSIEQRAFSRCTALTKVSLPVATSIGRAAFESCAALTEVSLPKATSIGEAAFSGCAALTEVSLPKAAPTLGYGMFGYINTARTVTVKVPSGATGYGTLPATYSGTDSTEAWGNGFRGGGWNGSSLWSGGSINSYITVIIQAQ
jgi:hypothetical protein